MSRTVGSHVSWPGRLWSTSSSVATPAARATAATDARGTVAREEPARPGADERGREGRQLRHVVGMEDPLGEAEGDGDREEHPARGDEPAGTGVRAPQAGDHREGDDRDDREAEQPAGLPAQPLVEQAQRAGGAAERRATARPPPPPMICGPPAWPSRRPRPL